MSKERVDPGIPVLLAVSEPTHLLFMEQSLAEFQFRNVSVVKDGYKAIHSGRFEKWGLVFLDDGISKVSGLKVLESLRDHGKSSDAPVVFSVTKDQEEAVDQAKAAGASAVLFKPANREDLRRATESALDRSIVTKAEEEQQNQQNTVATEAAVERGKKLLAKGDFGGAETAFEEAMVTGGGSLDVFSGLAEVYLYRGNLESAEQVLAEAERIDPQARDRFRAGLSKFLEKGDRALEKEEYEKAKNNFEAVALMNRKDLRAWSGLWRARRSLGETEEADQAFSTAMTMDADASDLHVYNRMGIYARRAKDFEKAVRAFDRAISLGPDDPVLYYNKSLVFIVQRKLEEALELVNRALEIDPEFPQAEAAKKKIKGWSKAVAA